MDRHTGKILWEREVTNIPGSPATPPRTTDDTGLAAPSLTTDGNHVFALFGTGDIIGFDLNGNRLWARNLGVPRNHYGQSSSLLTWDNKVFVQYDTQAGSRVLALDSATGRTIWETSRTSDVSWASPIWPM
jgi:outer membrane protein assembly factor BamB